MGFTKLGVGLTLCAAFFMACKKDVIVTYNDRSFSTQKPVVYDSYLPLKVGSYWIYERFQVEQHGTSKSLNEFDSTYVVKDTMIRNNRFWIIKWHDFLYQRDEHSILRDSLHYIIGSNGKPVFSSQDFSTVFADFFQIEFWPDSVFWPDTVCRQVLKMNDKDLIVETGAGTFTTSNMQRTIHLFPKYSKPGVNNPRYINKRFSKNVGIISETEPILVSAPFVRERRLIRYKIN
jgi:hypothetical protein